MTRKTLVVASSAKAWTWYGFLVRRVCENISGTQAVFDTPLKTGEPRYYGHSLDRAKLTRVTRFPIIETDLLYLSVYKINLGKLWNNRICEASIFTVLTPMLILERCIIQCSVFIIPVAASCR